MNTLYGIGEEVFVKGIVKKIDIFSNSKGEVKVEYCIEFPQVNQNGFGNFVLENDLHCFPREATRKAE